MFNNYFYSVFTSGSTTSLVDNTMDTNVEQQIVSITISEHDTYEALSSLNPCKAVGMDDIGPKVLKGCAISLCKPFHYLYIQPYPLTALFAFRMVHTCIALYQFLSLDTSTNTFLIFNSAF